MYPKKNAEGIYDFDAMVIEPRLCKVGGEIVDVSVIPVAVSLAMAKRQDMTAKDCEAAAEKDSEGELRRLFQMVADVCMPSNPKITADFLMHHLNMQKFRVFMQFVLNPITSQAEEYLREHEKDGDAGNEQTDEQASD